MATLECLDDHTGECKGEVVNHPSLAGTGMAIPRCTEHWGKHIERDQQHRQVYPDSPIPPAWFDPDAAGERWDDDY